MHDAWEVVWVLVKVASMIMLTLPAPPSANALFRDNPRGGRIRTRLYDDWISHASWRLRAQNPGTIPGSVIVIMGVERSNDNADIDNRTKATLDLLVSQHIIDDDKHVIALATAWLPTRDNLMRVAIVPAQNLSLDFHLTDSRHGGWHLTDAHLKEEAA
jgi:Holliday junction resolvase RusA-like endonuclease